MYRNGQQVNAFLGEDRQLYINNTPGKSICDFVGRIWMQADGDNIISITDVPDKFDGKPVTAPPGWEIQGLDQS